MAIFHVNITRTVLYFPKVGKWVTCRDEHWETCRLGEIGIGGHQDYGMFMRKTRLANLSGHIFASNGRKGLTSGSSSSSTGPKNSPYSTLVNTIAGQHCDWDILGPVTQGLGNILSRGNTGNISGEYRGWISGT